MDRTLRYDRKAGLVGICFNGVQRVFLARPVQTANLLLDLRMQWLGMAVEIQSRNELMNR